MEPVSYGTKIVGLFNSGLGLFGLREDEVSSAIGVPGGVTSPAGQEKRNHSAVSTPESLDGRKDARLDGSPGSVSSTISSPVAQFMSSVPSPAKRGEECKHRFDGIVRKKEICCSFCKARDNTADMSCVECGADACKSCAGLLEHAFSEKRPHSATPPREVGDAHKDRRVDPGLHGADVMVVDSDDAEPLTQPLLNKEEVGLILREFKEQCEVLTRDHYAAMKKLSDKVREKLAIGGACLGNCEKKELLSGSLVRAEEAVRLLKALQGDSAEALAPPPKRIVGRALPDGVSIFVGGVPRESDNEVLLTLFPRGAQIEERFRGGKGKYGFLRLSVNSNEADQMIEQQVAFKERILRVAKWSEHAPKSAAGRVAHPAQHNGRPKKDGALGVDPVFGSPQEMKSRAKNSSLVLKSLKYAVDAKELLEVFPKATFTKVMYRDDGFSRGFGFVDFNSEDEATKAKNDMQGKKIAGRPVFIAYSLRQQHGDRSHPQDRRLAVAASGLA